MTRSGGVPDAGEGGSGGGAVRQPRAVFGSLRGRVILVVLAAAVVPLALIGFFVTSSISRAGESLLRSELEESRARIAAAIEDRWGYRRADLGLLASNVVAQSLLSAAGGGAPATADSQYLSRLFATLSAGIPLVEYRDLAGHVVFTLRHATPGDSADASRRGGAGVAPAGMQVLLPVVSSEGVTLGEMTAVVQGRAILPADTALRLPNGGLVQLVDRRTGSGLLPSDIGDPLTRHDRFTAAGQDWLAVRQVMAEPAVELVVAGPRKRYVAPFQSAARVGVMSVAVASLMAILLTAWLATRLTSSLENLADAADAVAGGELERRVDARGSTEVRRVAGAFNRMTESLRRTLGELSQRQALAAVGEYAASLSHEVRNALTSMRVDLQRADEKLRDNAETRALIARALSSVRRLDGAVTSSLRLARGGRATRRRVDLREVLIAAARGAESAFADRGAALHNEMNDETLVVRGDALAPEQLFLNLLLNAAQALTNGGCARIVADRGDSFVRVLIADGGSGISDQNLDRVLDPFFSTRPEGTGLGLPIARQIAVAHGGSLHIESGEGAGTRVEVRLPMAVVETAT
jgi:signal transduction histidine kinase